MVERLFAAEAATSDASLASARLRLKLVNACRAFCPLTLRPSMAVLVPAIALSAPELSPLTRSISSCVASAILQS